MKKMEEPKEQAKYIVCSTCKCKYHNNNEYIKNDL